jgi:hypothetical protein
VWFEKNKNSLNLKFKPYNISCAGQTHKDFIQAFKTRSELLFRHCSYYNDPRSVTLWLTLKSLYCPLLHGDLIVETELDLGDHLGRIRVDRDPALCELLNRDVGNLCDWPNFRNKSCISCAFLSRFTFCTCSSSFLF